MISDNSVTAMVSDMVKRYILENNLKTGSRLPSENELSGKLNVCRASIREALKSLESSGLLESVQGKGRYIKDFSYEKMVENFGYHLKVNFKDFKEVVQIRKALEISFLPKIAGDLDESDFLLLDSLIDKMEKQIKEGVPFNELSLTHAEFHKHLYKKLNNKMLDSLISMFTVFQQTQEQQSTKDDVFVKKHRDIVKALRKGDSVEIMDIMSSHFNDYDNL